jgi:hypothetical protein
MRISKEKYDQMKRRKRTTGGGRVGFRGVVTGGAVGAGAALAYETLGGSVAAVRDNWWAGPVGMLGIALAMGRSSRMRTPAIALAGAGGFSTYTNYRVMSAREAKGLVGTRRATFGAPSTAVAGSSATPRAVAT